MQLALTKDNYLYGTGSGDTWSVNIDPPKRKVKTYFEETLIAVEEIYANKTGKFQVLYSGGLDSQYVCEVLLRMGIDFEAVIIELKNNAGEVLNIHDISYAYEFCAARNIKPITYDLNFENFIDTGKNVDIAKSISCCAFSLPATLHVASQLDGFTLFGNDPPYMRFENGVWLLEELQYIHSLLRFYKMHNLNGCPFLLSYTPEMMLSFLLDPAIAALAGGQFPGKQGTNSTKSLVFNNGSDFNMPTYDFTKFQRVKFTGYELIYRSELMKHPNLAIFKGEFWQKWNGEYLEPYDDAVARLSIYQ